MALLSPQLARARQEQQLDVLFGFKLRQRDPCWRGKQSENRYFPVLSGDSSAAAGSEGYEENFSKHFCYLST